jgi:pimeloyl-[acyl-carrier protein] methyl ester esterase
MTVFVEASGRGPDLALLHGWGMNGAVWNGVREELAAHFTLHVVDLPGHGKSAGAPVTTRAALVEALHHALPDPCHVLGWSLGGHAALALAAAHPSRVKKIVTVGSTPRFVAGDGWEHGKAPEVLADFARRLAENHALTIRNFLALQALHLPGARDHVRRMQDAVGAHGEPSRDALAACLDILVASDLRAEISGISHAVLVMQGDHDALTSPAAARWLADTLPNAEYRLIEHAAHAPFLSHRERFVSEVLGFLKS